MVQWLGPCAFTVKGLGLIPGQETDSASHWSGKKKKAHCVKHRGYYDFDSHSYLEAYSTERQNNGSTLPKYLLHIFIL